MGDATLGPSDTIVCGSMKRAVRLPFIHLITISISLCLGVPLRAMLVFRECHCLRHHEAQSLLLHDLILVKADVQVQSHICLGMAATLRGFLK